MLHDKKNCISRSALPLFSLILLTAITSQSCFAEAKKISKVTYFVDSSVRFSRVEVFEEYDIGNRLTKAVTEKLAAKDLIDPQSDIELNLRVDTFKLRNAIAVGLFGFLHTGKDRLYYWVELKDGEQTEQLFQQRVSTLVGWLFFPTTNGRIDRMINKISATTADLYENR